MPFTETDRFRELALKFEKDGVYCNFKSHTNDYKEFWKEEHRRCIEGYTYNGIRITGAHYFYLNYCQILAKDEKTGRKKKIAPRFTDVDYEYFHLLERARLEKKGLILTKPRRTGFSYKNAALVTYEYNFFKDSKSIISAYTSKYSGNTMSMVLDNLNFLDGNTEWRKQRNPDTRDFVKARYKETIDGVEVWKGYMSEIETLTFKDNPFASVGKSASLFLFEEAGVFPNIIESYNISEPCWKDGDDTIGLPLIYGCVCAGTKVWTKEGKLINIEDLVKSDGLLGYNGNKVIEQTINWFKPPAKKECYRITLANGDIIECSDDHPLLITRRQFCKYKGNKTIKRAIYQEAKEIKINDQILLPSKIDKFGSVNISYARELGMMIGNGNYSVNNTPTLSCSDSEILNYLENKHGKLKYTKHYQVDDKQDYYQLSLPFMKKHLSYHGMLGQVKFDKKLPKDIHTFDKESLAELLAGYFDANGNVYYNKNKNIVRVVLTSIVKELLYEVKHQLHKFGIHCAILKENRNQAPSEEYAGQQDFIYRLYINQQQDLQIFKDNIHLLIAKKRNNLQYIKNSKYKITKYLFEINPLNNKEGYFNSELLEDLRYTTVKNVEYIGEKEVYNLNCGPNHNYISNGFITRQTGGDMGGGTVSFAEMFYNPEKFNLLALDNIWDKSKLGTKSGWFIPASRQRFGVYYEKETGKVIPLVDADGNSNEVYGEKSVFEFRNSKRGNQKAYTDAITQYPMTPEEAFLRTNSSIFPVALAQERLSELETTKSITDSYINANLVLGSDGTVTLKHSDNYPILDFPVDSRNMDIEGVIQIFETPVPGARRGVYIGGIDPYDDDASTTDSLGSTFIMNTLTNRIVAEYTGRPKTAKEYYENVRRLLIYYNAIANYENNKKGLFTHFEHKNSLHLLCDTPRILKDVQVIKTVYGSGNNAKGTQATKEVNKYARELIKTYMHEQAYLKTEGVTNTHTIPSIPLLKELIYWNADLNADRVSALGMLLILKEDIYRIIENNQKESIKTKAHDPFWSKLYKPNNILGYKD
jgi:hypothetical protein